MRKSTLKKKNQRLLFGPGTDKGRLRRRRLNLSDFSAI